MLRGDSHDLTRDSDFFHYMEIHVIIYVRYFACEA